MAEKKKLRDYLGGNTTKDGSTQSTQKKGLKDYLTERSTATSSKSTGTLKDYIGYDPATIVGNNVTNRVNSWLQNYNSLTSDYQKRYSGRKGSYEDAYVSDSADWYDKVSQQVDSYEAERQEILSYLNKYGGHLDADWVEKIRNTLAKGRDTQLKIRDSAKKDNEYWSMFTPNEEQVAAGYTADKLYSEWQTDRKQYAEDQAYDVEAGMLELEELKKEREAYLADYNEKKKQEQKDESFLDSLGRWLSTTPDTTIPLAGVSNSSGNTNPAEAYDKRIAELEEKINRSKYVQGYEGYMENMDAEGYAANSQYVSTRTDVAKDDARWGLYNNQYDESKLFGDFLYDYINGNQDALDVAMVNDTASDAYFLGIDKGFLKTMSKDEVGVFNSIYKNQSPEAAYEFVKFISSDLKGRKRQQEQAFWAAYAKESPVGSSVFSTLISPLKGLSYLGQATDMLDDGAMDQNAGYNRFSYIPSTIRSQVSTTIENSGKWGKVGSFAYNTGMSMADFLFTTAVSGGNQGLSLAIMGTGAAADVTIAAKDRGLDDAEAFALGTIAGIAEVAMEKISLGAWLDGDMTEGALRYVLKNALSEGGEEAGTSVINLLADVMISGDKSEWNVAMQAYIDQGKSPEEAFGLVAAEQAAQIGLDALGGILSGAAIGGGTYAGVSVGAGFEYGKTGKNKEAAQKIVTEGLELDPNNQYVQKMKSKLDKGKSLTGMQVRNVLAANQEQITANDIKKIQKAAQERLTSLGQTENVKELAEIATKWATGQELTSAEKKTLTHSEYGSRVANELLPKNIQSGGYSSEWAENIGTKQVNKEAYNKELFDKWRAAVDEIAKMNDPATYKALDERVDEKDKLTVSKTGKATIRESNVEIDLSKPEIVDFVKDKSGNVTDIVLNVDGNQVKASQIDFADDNQSYLFSAVKHIENITPGDAQVIIRDYNPSSGVSVSAYLNGVDEAFTYGYNNYSEADMQAGEFTIDLTEQQAKGAYLLGKAAKNSSNTAKTESIKRMRTAAEAEAQKAAAEGKEAPKAKGMTITYNAGNGNVVDFKKAGPKKLSKEQKAAPALAEAMHEMGLGTNFELYESYLSEKMFDEEGNRVRVRINENGVEEAAPAGIYRKSDGTVCIDLNAYNGRELTLDSMAHELTHFIQQWSDTKYQVLAEFLVETYDKKTDLTMHERVIREQARLESIRKEKISYNEAFDEVVANAMSKMLADGKVMDVLAELQMKDAKLAKKLWEGLKKLLNKFFRVYEKYPALFNDAADLMELKEEFEQMKRMWAEAFVEASGNFQTYLTAAESQALTEAGFGFDENTKSVYSLQFSNAVNEEIQVGKKAFNAEAIAQLVSKVTGRSIEDARKWVQSEMTIANIVIQNPEFLDFEADNRYDAIKKNSDYPQGTVDLSNLCPKREEFTAMFDMLQKKYPNKLFTAQDVADMRKILADNDITVACGACFVEDRRQLIGEIADTFIGMWKEAVESGKPLQKTNAAGNKVELLVTKALAKQYGLTAGTKIMATDTYIPNQYDLTTYEGFKKLEKNHPTIAMSFNRYNNSRGQQSARLIEGRAAYDRQILGWSDAKVRSVNNNSGLRIFSFSDFEVVHLLDLVQVIIDCAAKGVKIQGYTKIPAFAKLVSNTGVKLNRSHIPKGDYGYHMENGKVVLDQDTTEGIDTNDKNFMDESDNPDVGDVIIGINPIQIGAAMLDPFFDYIIPFHSNKAKAILEKLGTGKWVNYKESQHEKDIATGTASKRNVNIYTEVINKYHPTNKVEFVEAFLKECKRQGKIPRYAEFLNVDANGDYAYREGYHKLLVDFKMFDKDGNILPQGNITPNLDEAFMKELLSAEIDKKQNYEFPKEVYDAIDKKFGEQYSSQETDLDSDGNKISAAQQAFFKDSKVRDANGRLMVLYHGTPNGSTTIFDKSKTSKINDMGQGIYFSTNKGDASSYMGKSRNKKLYSTYVNIKAPFVVSDNVRITVAEAASLLKLCDDRMMASDVYREIKINAKDGYITTAQLANTNISQNMTEMLEKSGKYDGIIDETVSVKFGLEEGTKHIIALNSNQIKLIDNQKPTTNPDIRYSSQETDADGFKDYVVTPAVYNIRNEKAKRGHDLVRIGNMPTLYRGLFGLSGDVYVSNEHLYQNMVSRETAEAEGRFNPDASADYHDLGEVKVINAIEQFQDPLVIMESLKDFKEPRLVAILDEKGNDGENLIAVLELYSEQRAHGVSQKRNHVLITIYEKTSLPDYIEKTGDKDRILHIRKGSSQISQAGLQLAGEISEKILKKNVARFNKKVKAFKEKNNIQYSSQETDADNAPIFYSKMGKVIEGMKQDKFGASSVISMLRDPKRGVKAEEIRWSGIQAFLDGKKSVTKQELLDFIKGSMLQIEETMLDGSKGEPVKLPDNYRLEETENGMGDPILNLYIDDELVDTFEQIFDGSISSTGDSDIWAMNEADLQGQILNHYAGMSYDEAYGNGSKETRWDKYTLDGGENYRELLFKMPGAAYDNQAMEAHWGDHGYGVLAHARIQDFNTFIGKMLFIEEIQSDWHNAGHKSGYRVEGAKDKEYFARKTDAHTKAFFDSDIAKVVTERISKIGYEGAGVSTVLSYLVDSQETMESTLRMLERRGATFTDSEVSEIRQYAIETEEIYQKWQKAPGIDSPPEAPFSSNYHEYVLKRLLRMAAEEGYDSIGWTTADIQINRWSKEYAEGYRIEYDQDIPKFLKKYGKQWGSTVGKTTLDNGTEVWSMAITDAMQKSVLTEGQAMYSSQQTDLDVGYHAGDLGKAESLRQQGFGRDTGHFGTGTYFVGNKASIEGYNSRNGKPAPVETVDFNKYNLFKPKNAHDGFVLHDFLRGVDGYWNRDENAVNTMEEYESLQEKLSELVYDIESEEFGETDPNKASWMAVERAFLSDAKRMMGDYKVGKALTDTLNRLTDGNYQYDARNGEYYSYDFDTDQFTSYTEDEIIRMLNAEEGGWKAYEGIVKLADDYYSYSRTSRYESWSDSIKDVAKVLGISEQQVRNVFQGVTEGIKSSGYTDVDMETADSAATRFMKALGYEGIDVRGIKELDNTSYGSVIYDLKGEDLARKKAIGTARYSTQETDLDTNRYLLANAFEGITKDSKEYELIQEYKGRIKILNEYEEKLRGLNAEIRKILFDPDTERDAKKLKQLQAEAKEVEGNINRNDKKLLSLEASEPLRKVIERERKKESKKTKDHVKQLLKNKKDRAEQTELRHKIRKAVRDLDKLLNRGNKKLNVKEDMKGFVSKALDLADYLFTDHITNDELIRRGITVPMRGNEPQLVKETEEILTKLYDEADSLTDEEFTRLDEKRKANEAKLKELLTAQRNERLSTPVYQLFDDLVTEYANLKNAKQDSVRAAYNEELENSLRAFISDNDRVKILKNMRVTDMTTEELNWLYRAYTMVLTNVRNANKFHVQGMAESIEQVVGQLSVDFGSRKIPEKKLAIAAQKLANKIGWSYEKLYYALDRIGSDAFTKLIMNLADSENIVMQDIIEAMAFRDEIVKNYGFNNWDINKEIDREFLDNTGKKFKLTLGQMMSLYAYSRRKGAWDHIEYGGFVFGEAALTNPKPADSYKLSKDQCEAITNLLTKEQKGYVEDMQKFLSETMGAKGNEVSMQLYGIKMFGEENYFPIHVAGQFKAQAQESQAKAAAGFSSMSNAGFTHAQNPNAKAPFVLEGFNDVWSDHVNEMSRYHGTVPALEDIRRVMNRSTYSDSVSESQSVKQMMENHYGKEAVEYFDNLYREANSGAITDKLQKDAKKLLSLFRKNSVAYSLSVIVQQPTALVRAYSMIDKKYFGFKGFGTITSGVAKAVTSKWNPAYANAYNEMMKYAPGVTMAKQIGGFDTATGSSIRSTLMDTGKSFKQKWNTGTALEKGKAALEMVDDNAIANLPNVADKIAWIEIWNACKRETVAKHKDLAANSEEFMQAVGERFTEVIRATQVYDSIFAKSPMLKSKSLGVQMLVSFMNEPNTVANMVEKSVRDTIKGDWKSGLRTGAAVIYSIIFNNVLKSMVYALRDDDEDESYIEKYIEAITGGMMDDFWALNYIPVVRDAWSLAQGFDVERADMAIVADALGAVGKVIQNGITDKTDMTEEDLIEFDKKVTEANWKLVESLAAFLGIPVKNIRRDIVGVLDHARIAAANAGMTTELSLWDKVTDSVIDWIPFMSGKSKQDKLYDAIISGDKEYLGRLKSTYKTDDAYQSAVRKVLRENDPRIKEAAQARYDGNTEEYKRIFREIQNEGNFVFDDIMGAINTELSKLTPDKATSDYTASGYVEAIAMGNTTEAVAMKDDIIATKVANGKTQKEAEKEFASNVASGIKDAYTSGMLDDAEAEKMLMEYAGKDEEEAASKVSYWSFIEEHQEYKNVFTESHVEKYREFAEPAGITVDVYAQFINGTKGIKPIKDKWGDVEVPEWDQIVEVIHALPLTRQQKDALYMAADLAESKIWEVPW